MNKYIKELINENKTKQIDEGKEQDMYEIVEDKFADEGIPIVMGDDGTVSRKSKEKISLKSLGMLEYAFSEVVVEVSSIYWQKEQVAKIILDFKWKHPSRGRNGYTGGFEYRRGKWSNLT